MALPTSPPRRTSPHAARALLDAADPPRARHPAAHPIAAAVLVAAVLGLQLSSLPGPAALGVAFLVCGGSVGLVVVRGRARAELRPAADARRQVLAEERIRVFLCDDAAALRALLRACLELHDDLAVVGEAGDGTGLATAVRDTGADVLLLDLSMPNVDGLEALADLRATNGRIGVVVLSGFDAERMGSQALALGADRYVEKTAAMHEIAGVVRAVAAARRGPRSLPGAVA